jgi:hypothetical protein
MDKSDDALDSAALSAGFFKRINGGRMDTGDMAAMGLNSIMGQGMIGNAQNSLMGNAAQQASWNAAQINANPPLIVKSSYPYKENKPRVSMQLDIVQADNGFIVNIGEEPFSGRTPHVALTIEDICTIITSQLASRMLDRAE